MYVANTTGGLMLQTMLYLANHTSRAAVNTLIDLPPAAKSDINEVKCFGVYGCFPINGPWNTVTRTISVHPQKPSEIEPHFTLHTRRTMDQPKYIDLNDPDSVQGLGINKRGRLYLIVHGYLESGDIPWMLEMAKALMNHCPENDCSVILIDWGGGASPPYVQAVANTRLVGAITAHVVHMLYEELRLPNLDKVHIIGHSLGAHLSGYAGSHLQRDFGLKMGRITGLDPAAPLFTDTDPIVRLDRSDAHFVDIVHTDANPLMKGGLGIIQRLGHVDFYPNGGFDNPGCDKKLQDVMKNNRKATLFLTMQEFLGCNHIRSEQYFTESIEGKCPFLGMNCDSFDSFKDAKCSSCDEPGRLCMRMGFHSEEDYREQQSRGLIKPQDPPPVFYLMTGERKPFCRLHYKITVRVSSHDESTLHGGEIGTLSIRLHGEHSKKSTERMKFSPKPMYFEPGFDYTALLPGKDLRDPGHATVFWEYQTNILNPLTWRLLSSPRIYLEYILIESMESSDTYLKLCPLHESAILSGTENVLHTRYCKD
ncbi:pancreatic lipase-related protein 2 [Drosophila innubila]|uniref:pancreatic lipase-related protein 2 n=1 Tax=Drosophila innubila TaxID=198719 RepID=UPI00148D72C8|nr:pancreatic lipase-related protein 2 [Drosophila innubila]XP_034480939.1 pancreatic lipase-related protein 2 [Drosophila innubila]